MVGVAAWYLVSFKDANLWIGNVSPLSSEPCVITKILQSMTSQWWPTYGDCEKNYDTKDKPLRKLDIEGLKAVVYQENGE